MRGRKSEVDNANAGIIGGFRGGERSGCCALKAGWEKGGGGEVSETAIGVGVCV